jgi:RHS repeat-associated protein
VFRNVKYFTAVLMVVMLFGIAAAQGDLDNDGILDETDSETLVNENTSLSAGEYSFQTLSITNNAVLTLNSNTSLSGFKGVKINAINLFVYSGATISADGLGYPPNQGPGVGRSTNDNCYMTFGASGYGGTGGGPLDGPPYGSALNPVDLGSGGKDGQPGGGAILITVNDTVSLDGKISANGGNFSLFGSPGSGGSINLNSNRFTGSGIISANGGSGGSFNANGCRRVAGSSGGGRIAIRYQSSTFNGDINANSPDNQNGDGTIAFIDKTNNYLYTGKSFNFQENDSPFIFNHIIFSNSKVSSAGNISITTSDFELNDSKVTIDGVSSSINSENLLFQNSTLLLKGGSHFSISQPSSISDSKIDMTNAQQYLSIPSLTLDNSSITLAGAGTLRTSDLILTNHSLITTVPLSKIDLQLTNLNIDGSSVISADGLGYPPNQGPGVGQSTNQFCDMNFGGSGYGGTGGGGALGGPTYGSALNPVDLGSGGKDGQPGGGAILITANDTVSLDGKISANGGNFSVYGGPGSGGSINLNSNRFTGSGIISANGGSGGSFNANGCRRVAGSSGGGRIAGYYNTSTFSGIAEATGYNNGTVVINPGMLILNTHLHSTISPGKTNVYYFVSTDNQTLTVQLAPDNNQYSFSLYCSHENLPDKTKFDISSLEKNPNGNYELIISPTINGTYILSVYSENTYSSSYTISVSEKAQYLSNIYPRSVMKTPDARVTVVGTGFVSGMQVELRNQNTTSIHAFQVIPVSPTSLTVSFDLTNSQLGLYDVSLIWPDLHEETFTSALTISDVGEGMLYEPINLDLPAGGTYTRDLVIPGTSSIYFTLRKSTYPTDAHWSWTSEMTLTHEGNVTATSTSNQDPIIQLKNPEPGHYTLTIKATEAGKGVLTIRSSLPEMPPGNWVIDTIQRPFGSSFHQVTVPAGMDRLTIEAETMNIYSFFRIYYDTYGGSPKWITSYSQTQVTIPHPVAGRYIVEFVDPQVLSSTDQKRDILLKATTESITEPPTTYIPAISGFMPILGGNTGIVTLQINGGWLDPNSTVILSDGGAGNITALSVEGTVDHRSLTASFDLQGKVPGSYTLTVQSPTGTAISAPISFLIEEGGKSELWTELTGMEKIRVGRPAKYILKYGNKGNLDMPAPVLSLATDPPSGSISVSFPPSQDLYSMNGAVSVVAKGPADNPDILPAGYSSSIEVLANTNQMGDFSLILLSYGGDPMLTPGTTESSVDAAAPAPGIPLVFGRSYPGSYSGYTGPFGTGWVHSYDMRLDTFADGTIGLMNGDKYITLLLRRGNQIYSAEGGYPELTRNPDSSAVLKMRDGSSIGFGTNQKPSVITDTNGNQVVLSYTGEHLTGIQHSDGDHFTLTYGPAGRMTGLTDHAGKTTTYSYNPENTLLNSVTGPDGKTTSYYYVQEADTYALASVTYPGGISRNFRFDGDGRLAESSLNSNKNTVPLSYDDSERTTTVKDASGVFVTSRVNENGQVTKTENTAGATQLFSYNQNKDLVRASDPLGHSYDMSYDNEHNVVEITDPLGNHIGMTYDNRFNSLNSVTDPRGNTLNFGFDSKGNMISTIYPDSLTESNVYDTQGNIIRTTTRKGDIINYQYNTRGQLTRIDYPDSSFKVYTYDNTGNMLTTANQDGPVTLEYNAQNQPTRILFPDGNSFVYTYDSAGRLRQRTEKDGYSTIYGYDDIGNLIQVSDGNMSVIARYTYDSAGKLQRKEVRNGGYTTYAYDNVGQISLLVNYNSGGVVLSRFDYQYDAAGNPVSVDTLEGMYHYGYDATGQLVNVTYPGGQTTQYTYDAAGNRVSVVDDGSTTTYSTNAMNQYTQAGSATFSYDANGNIITKTEAGKTTTYEYNYDNRLTRVLSLDGVQEYTYDALGNRVGVKQNGTVTKYSVDPLGIGDVVAEYNGNGTLLARYTHGLGLVSKIDSAGKEYEYHFSPIGHTSEITDSAGTVVNRYQYAPFGEYRQKVEGIDNPFTYVGEYGVMDDRNGLQYMRMRYYNPNLGRFISEDPISIVGGNLNLNTYCNNKPIESIDPIGLYYSGGNDFLSNGGNFFYDAGVSKVSTQIAEAVKKHKARSQMRGFLKGADKWNTGIGYAALVNDILSLGETIHDPQKNRGDTLNDLFTTSSDLFDLVCKHPGTLAVKHSAQFGWSLGRVLGQTPLLTDPSITYDQMYQKFFSNRFIKKITPTTSVDPEDKFGPTGYDPAGTPSISRNRYITDESPLNYRIDFWNAETATANVCDVDAYDQMDSDLNWSTFQFTEVGFTNWTIPLEPTQYFNVYVDPRPSIPYIVQIEGVYDPATGKANLTYHTLNATTLETPEDPLAGFLPPISNSGTEIGWFAYTVSPKSGLSTGTAIDNQAFINFDYSQFMPAPKDAPWHNTIDTGAPSTSVSATLTNQTEIHFTLSGSDNAGGSGIKDYTMYGSDNGGVYTPYLNHISSTSGMINGIPDHTYRFYSIARDNVGNTEPIKSQPDATVFIPVPLSAPRAWFTASPNSGPAPLTVNFTDQSDNNPITWNWNFGDGSAWVNGTTQSLSHIYTGAGSYTVTLVVSNSAGQDQTQRIITVTTPTVLTANFTSNVTSGAVPLSVQFNDTSTGSPTTWHWEFGDGGNSTIRNATHIYSYTGLFTANLTVTNGSVTDTESKMDYINVTSKALLPLPGFTNPPTDPDGDGLYEDLNGNARKDFNDVVVMFNQMQWIAANEPLGAFDFDFNANGRIDFNDIVKLFGEI